MDLVTRIALLSCLLISASYVDAEITVLAPEGLSDSVICYAQEFEVNISCKANATMSTETMYDDNGSGNYNGSNNNDGIEYDMICIEIEFALHNATESNINYTCDCTNLICSSGSNFINFNCTNDTAVISTTTENNSTIAPGPTDTPKECNCTDLICPVFNLTCSDSECNCTCLLVHNFTCPNDTTTTPATVTDEETTTVPATVTSVTTLQVITSHDQTTDATLVTLPPTVSNLEFTSTTAVPSNSSLMIVMVLWIVLGCLIALIVITLGAIFLVSVAHCRRHKRKKQPTALDIISKWEDTPNESSDIQLLSMKIIGEGEDKDDEEQKDDRVEDKEAEKEGSDGKLETKEVNKEDDVTVGTFGFVEKVAEPTASNAETPTTVTESEKKEDQNKKDEAAKVDKNEKLVEVTIEKAGEESATNMGSGENPPPENKSITGTDTTVSTEMDKAQEGTKLEPVPVQIPLLGKQVADEKAPDNEQVAQVKTTEQSDKPASPSKDQAVKPETSPSNSKDVSATESVSKEPESAATITNPQTEDVKTVSLASDKPPDSATGGFSLFTNEDMEKALGVAATIDLGQVESTQL